MPKIQRRMSGEPTRALQGKSGSGGPTDFMLVHVTATGWAREILRSGQIETRACKVFGDTRLTYFFALRPAYKIKKGGEPAGS